MRQNKKSNIMLLVVLVSLILLSSCGEPTQTLIPKDSQIVESESPSVEPNPTDIPSASIEPSPTPSYTFTLPPTPTPTAIPTMPDTYTKAEYFAFDETTGTITGYNVRGGVYVSIPDKINGVKVERIGEYAFYQTELYGVLIPLGVTEIQKGAFAYCFLKEAKIPESVKIIGEKAFWANSLDSINLPKELASLGAESFTGNDLKEISIPNSLSRIEDGVFNNNNLTNVDIPVNIIYIGERAFSYNKLIKVTLHDGISFIGEGAFSNNNLSSIKLPSSLSEISTRAFHTNLLINVTIPDGVKQIGASAFENNKIQTLVLGKGITKIKEKAFLTNSITSLLIPDNIEKIGESAFQNNKIVDLEIGKGLFVIESSVFANNAIKKLVIPDNVTQINDSAFYDNAIDSLIIGKNIRNIGKHAFQSNHIVSIIIPDNVKMIHDEAFAKNDITNITVVNDVTYISNTTFDAKEGMTAFCVKGSYAEYFFNKKALHISNIDGRSYEEKVPHIRKDLVEANISCLIEQDEFYFAENWVREYLKSKYTSSFVLKSFNTKTEEDIIDKYISPYNRVFIKNYLVSFEYKIDDITKTEEKVLKLVVIKTKDNLNVLSGIVESNVNFTIKHDLLNYLSVDDRFTYWNIPDKSVRFSTVGDVAASDFYPEKKPVVEDPDKYIFPGTDYKVVALDGSIYLENIITGEKKVLKSHNGYDLVSYGLDRVIDSKRYIYKEYRYGCVEGLFIHDIIDNSLTSIYYPEYDICLEPLYTDNNMTIISNKYDLSFDFNSLYRTFFSGDEIGKLVKISSDVILSNQYTISADGRYIAYDVTSNINNVYNADFSDKAYFVADDQRYYSRFIKVVDTLTGEVVKKGMIYEEVSQNDNLSDENKENRGRYLSSRIMSFEFHDDNNLYIKYGDKNFMINMN